MLAEERGESTTAYHARSQLVVRRRKGEEKRFAAAVSGLVTGASDGRGVRFDPPLVAEGTLHTTRDGGPARTGETRCSVPAAGNGGLPLTRPGRFALVGFIAVKVQRCR